MIGHFWDDISSKESVKTPLDSLRYMFAKARGKIIEKSAVTEFCNFIKRSEFRGASQYIDGVDKIYAVCVNKNKWDLYRSRVKVYKFRPVTSPRARMVLPVFLFNRVAQSVSSQRKDLVLDACKKGLSGGMDLDTIEKTSLTLICFQLKFSCL
jgi:hypothetical protein